MATLPYLSVVRRQQKYTEEKPGHTHKWIFAYLTCAPPRARTFQGDNSVVVLFSLESLFVLFEPYVRFHISVKFG